MFRIQMLFIVSFIALNCYGKSKKFGMTDQSTSQIESSDHNANKSVILRLDLLHSVSMIGEELSFVFTDSKSKGAVKAELEFLLSEDLGAGIFVSYRGWETGEITFLNFNSTLERWDVNKLELGAFASLRVKRLNPRAGFWMRPWISSVQVSGRSWTRDANGKVSNASLANTRNGITGGADAILRISAGTGFNIEMGGGVNYSPNTYILDYNNTSRAHEENNRLGFRFLGSVGWAF